MIGPQGPQTPIQQRRSMDSLNSRGTRSSTSSPLLGNGSSSFSTFRDMEVPLGGMAIQHSAKLNDDAMEKSLRRRSLLEERAARRRSLLSLTASSPGRTDLEDGSTSELNNGGNSESTRRRSNQNYTSPGRSKLRPSGSSSLLGIVEASHQTPLPSLLKVSADSFEQWLKLATDNKINANNSWNFALIDYFHEMSLLREGDSINFQKASCTLDGCVKIYTSRVDSVATETTKLLGGLVTSSKGNEGQEKDEDAAEENEDEEEEEQCKPVKRKHPARHGNSLAKDFKFLSLEKFNLEFKVDPLFKKTSADFDEGGARGLLLNHLSVDMEGKIIFDAGDARDEGDDKDEEDGVDEREDLMEDQRPLRKSAAKRRSEVEPVMIDIQRLRKKFLPTLHDIFEKDICPSLKDFHLTGNSDMDLSFIKQYQGHSDDEGDKPDVDDLDGNGVDGERMGIDAYDDNDDGQAHFDTIDDGVDSQDLGLELGSLGDARAVLEDAFGGLDEEIASHRVGPAFDHNLTVPSTDLLGNDQVEMYKFFDAALMRNWAGPQHWKLRKAPKAPVEKVDPAATSGATEDDDEDAPPVVIEEEPKKRTAKVALVINFLSNEEVEEEEIFEPVEAWTILFSKIQTAAHRQSKNVLPDDIHFSSKQLLKMFMKPSFVIKAKARAPLSRPTDHNTGQPELISLAFPDEEFWASHTNNVEADPLAMTVDQTQIYNDYIEDDDEDFTFRDLGGHYSGGPNDAERAGQNGDGTGVDDEDGLAERARHFRLGDDGDGNDYASQLVSHPKRVKASAINFSKTAKKVDVKKLKDNIWKEMTQQRLKRRRRGSVDEAGQPKNKKFNLDSEAGGEGEEAKDEQGDEEEGQDEDGDKTVYVQKEQKFTEIIGGLNKIYPEQKLKEISVPFCFICLLHLANEKNLSIVGSDNLAELTIKQE